MELVVGIGGAGGVSRMYMLLDTLCDLGTVVTCACLSLLTTL